ncbi:MAG TPA: DUF2334 domain-containing protein [Candidatus Nitrosocosmicus sp.]
MITPLLGPNGKIPLLIRDDDINFFTKSSMLEKIYGDAWENQFKTSLSIIPYQKGINDVCIPPNVRKSNKYYSFEENKELCLFLQEKIKQNNIEIIQHGVSHIMLDGRGEYSLDVNKYYEMNMIFNEIGNIYFKNFKINNIGKHHNIPNNIDFESYTNVGKDIIKKSIGITPEFFAPPYDDISLENVRLLLKQNIIPVYGQSIYHKFFRSSFIPNRIKKYLANKIMKKFDNTGFIVPFILLHDDYYNRQNQGIMLHLPKRPSRNLFSNNGKGSSQPFVDWILSTITYCNEHRTPLCILNHYHHYFYDWNCDTVTRKDLFDQWKKILDLMNNIPFSWKTSFFELYERIKGIKKIRISKTGSKITIDLNHDLVENISFKIDNNLKFESSENILFDEQNETIFTIIKLKPDFKYVFYSK